MGRNGGGVVTTALERDLAHITKCPHGGWAWDGQCRCGINEEPSQEETE